MDAVSRYYLAAAEGSAPPPDWVYGVLFALIFFVVFWPRK